MTPSEHPVATRVPKTSSLASEIEITSTGNSSRWTTEDVRSRVEKSKVVVFAKGTKEHPLCGFSELVFSAIERSGRPYELVDVSKNRSIVPALKAYSGSPYVPLVFVNGELVSSSETLSRMVSSGELNRRVEAAFGKNTSREKNL